MSRKSSNIFLLERGCLLIPAPKSSLEAARVRLARPAGNTRRRMIPIARRRRLATTATAQPMAPASAPDTGRPGDATQFQVPASRTTAHVSLDDLEDVDWLLSSYQMAGAENQIVRLLGRNPAARVPMGDPYAVGNLPERLQEVGAGEQVQVLAARAAAHVSLDKPALVARLLDTLQRMGLEDQAAVLADRAAGHVAHPATHVTGHLVGNQRQMVSRDRSAVSPASPPPWEKDMSEFFSKPSASKSASGSAGKLMAPLLRRGAGRTSTNGSIAVGISIGAVWCSLTMSFVGSDESETRGAELVTSYICDVGP
jgi:hypothetical protein